MAVGIVLVEPEIPQNTGNIARTCAATGSSLHLVRPLGFSVDDKYLKRAGLDYWKFLDIYYYENFEAFMASAGRRQIVFVTTKADKSYTDFTYRPDCYLVFGKETKGLPEELLAEHHQSCVRIPMAAEARSLNLSNAAAITVYEVYRQHNFNGMQQHGMLHHLSWRDQQ